MGTVQKQGTYIEDRANIIDLFEAAKKLGETQFPKIDVFEIPASGNYPMLYFNAGNNSPPEARNKLTCLGLKDDTTGGTQKGPVFASGGRPSTMIYLEVYWEILSTFEATLLPAGKYSLQVDWRVNLFGQTTDPIVKSMAGVRVSMTNAGTILSNEGAIGGRQFPDSGWQAAHISGAIEFQLSDFININGFPMTIVSGVAGGQFVQFLRLSYQLIQE
jgi:hypothetical protein